MKILLTGKPKSGKTSLLTELIADESAKQGFVALEVLQSGVRIGFDLLDNAGRTASLAHTDHPTPYRVGRYFVQVDNLDTFIESLPEPKPGQLLYCDEIGQMQLYSSRFQQLVQDYLSRGQDFIGTVSAIYKHPLLEALCAHVDILVCEVDEQNRSELKNVLAGALANRQYFNHLTLRQQGAALDLARDYLQHAQYISATKLFKNALLYVQDDRLERLGPNSYVVHGKTAQHTVQEDSGQFTCDCDFFSGRGKFMGKAGQCSHIQAVLLGR